MHTAWSCRLCIHLGGNNLQQSVASVPLSAAEAHPPNSSMAPPSVVAVRVGCPRAQGAAWPVACAICSPDIAPDAALVCRFMDMASMPLVIASWLAALPLARSAPDNADAAAVLPAVPAVAPEVLPLLLLLPLPPLPGLFQQRCCRSNTCRHARGARPEACQPPNTATLFPATAAAALLLQRASDAD